MKKLMALILAVVTVFGMMGFTASAEKSSPKLKIGVVQIMEHKSLDLIRDSFLEEMEALGYGEDKVDYSLQSAQGEQSNLSSICKKFVGDGVDLMVAIATPTAQAAAAATNDIPILFSAVTDPVTAKLCQDPMHPDRNITGTSDAIPVDEVMKLCQKLTPDVKSIGFLYTSSEVNAQVTAKRAMEEAKAMGYDTKEISISEISELQQAAEALAKDVEAIYVPIDNTIAQAMQILSQVGVKHQIPVYTGADSMVADGGFATVGIEYDKLGKKTAAMAVKILEGTPVSQVPVETLDSFGTFINQDTANQIGVELPKDIAEQAVLLGEPAGSHQEVSNNKTKFYSLFSAVELGLIYSLMVLGLFLSYRILNIPDLTVDSSFTLGAAVSVVMTLKGMPILGMFAAGGSGAAAGFVTAFLQTKMKIQPILAGIITMTGLYSINLMTMGGKSNLPLTAEESLYSMFGTLVGKEYQGLILSALVAGIIAVVVVLFLSTPLGLCIRATGDNEEMVRSSSINANVTKTIGLCISNGCVALSGALIAQYNCYAEVRMGIGMVVIGLASLILGEIITDFFVKRRTILSGAIAAIAGSILYRMIIAQALEFDFSASCLKLITAVIVAAAMSYPAVRESIVNAKIRKAGR